MDYRTYCWNWREILLGAILCGVAAVVFAWLFYRSPYGLILFVPFALIYRKEYEQQKKKERKNLLLREFKEGIVAVSGALLAGYSVENAWRAAEKELWKLYGEKSMGYLEFSKINGAVRMNQPLETALLEFAARSDCEDIMSFAEVFSFAKRSGGDFAGIIQTTVQKLVGKIELEQEIEAVLAGKKLEGRIMNAMPILILAYLNLSCREFLDVLYGNAAGALIMSGALCMYALSLKLSEKILAIQV